MKTRKGKDARPSIIHKDRAKYRREADEIAKKEEERQAELAEFLESVVEFHLEFDERPHNPPNPHTKDIRAPLR